ncbi:MAG: CHAT domain-containing protein [Pirellulaceae bacterium]|nr:CHAT domain-containing protein [Pirellulaceae bacterium]
MQQLDKEIQCSTSVEGILKTNGKSYELAKIGLNTCVLKSPSDVPEGDADIILRVDESERIQRVKILPTRSGDKTVRFTRAQTRILFVGASPLAPGYSPISSGPEYNAIESSKKKANSSFSNQFDLRHCFAATPEKLLEHLTQFQPNILHFACHGESNKLIIETGKQQTHYVHLDAFQQVVKAQKELKLIVFNACFSNHQAATVVDEVDAAIGMNDAILDDAAIEFAREFYHRIFCGFDLQNAFDSAKASLALNNTGQESLPELYSKNGINAEDIEFAHVSSPAESFLGGQSFDQIVDRLTKRHDMLTTWPKTVGNNRWIERPELEQVKTTISDEKHSTTLLLGSKGTGKSALLSELACQLSKTVAVVISVKAEYLPKSVSSLDDLGKELLGFSCDPIQLIQYLAVRQKVVLIVDQLDAVAELMDRESNRLNILLNFLRQLHRCLNVHVVASCREFEYRHDLRLTTMNADVVMLELPSWEQVASILQDEGQAVERMTPEMRELLRTPWHLKMFLSVFDKSTEYKTLHYLIQAVWDKSVLNADGPSGRIELTRELAKRISQEEELWIDASFCDKWPAARDYLVAQDVLILETGRRVVGFRHQTYFDFVLATIFAANNENLVAHVMSKEESLFVRPTLLSALNWLRDVQPTQYQEQLKLLFESNPRTHIWTLLIEFVGNQSKPLDAEVSLLLPLLDSEPTGKRVLASVAYSRGWFERLMLDERFAKWLKKDANEAAWCIRPLQTGIRFDSKRVLTLVREHWFTDSTKDNLLAAVLGELQEWDKPTAKMVEKIARRSMIHSIGKIADDIAKQNACLAPAIVRAALEFRSENPADNRFGKRIDRLVKDCDFYELDGLAEDAPEEFLNELLPWFVEYVSKNKLRGSRLNHYFPDNVTELRFDRQLPDDELCVSLCIAAEKLAEKSPVRFTKVVNSHANSEMIATHKILMRGLLKLCESMPETVLNYLVDDNRRFFVECGNNSIGLSSQLITVVFPNLTSSQRQRLEESILAYKSYTNEVLQAEPASGRKLFLRWSREYRLRLLNSIPDDCISTSTAKIRDDERGQLCDSETERRYWEGGRIGSRMTSEEIIKAKPTDLFNLIDRMTESENAGDSDRWDTRFSANRAGGTHELNNEIQTAVSADRKVGERLVALLDPKKHDATIAAVVSGLSASDLETGQLHAHLDELLAKGCDGTDFREAAARAIASRATNDNPAPQHFLDKIFEWCVAFQSKQQSESENEKPEDSILYFKHSRSMMLAGSKGILIRSYFDCYRVEEPKRPELLHRLMEKLIELELDPEVLSEVIYFFRDLFGMDKNIATSLYDQAICSCPEILQFNFCAFSIASLIHLVEPEEKILEWLKYLKAQNNDLSCQIYGELLFLIFQRTGNSRYETLIRDQLADGLSPTLVGLGYAAAYFWNQPHCRSLATEILVLIAESDDGNHRKVTEYALLLDESEGYTIDQYSKRFIRAVIENSALLHEFVDPLSEIIEEFVEPIPRFALEAATKLAAEIESNPDRWYQIAPESITNIAVTLHRRMATRKEGLALFEKILSLNLFAARSAIDLLDRKPASRFGHFFPNRRRRRRRSRI